MHKIRVIVVDDSAVMRHLLSEIINREPDMQAIAGASDPLAAVELMRRSSADVMTLDMEIPGVDALQCLEQLMRERPMPVVMVSALAEANSEVPMRALELGAMELVAKQKIGAGGLEEYAHEVPTTIRAAAAGRLRGGANRAAPRAAALAPHAKSAWADKVIVIGASTGGTEAVKDVLVHMPPTAPPILVAQHMPEGFTKSFAARLDSLCALRVKEAEDGEHALPGHAYIAPGHSHLTLSRSGGSYLNLLSRAGPVNRHRPSVDVLFRSAARAGGANILGVILTGMGKDGAAGMAEMHRQGAYTCAQDEATCVVFGMPKEAIAHGGVDEILSIDEIAPALLARLSMSVATSR
jgi:two-component system chemotaxis response regulator CheB